MDLCGMPGTGAVQVPHRSRQGGALARMRVVCIGPMAAKVLAWATMGNGVMGLEIGLCQ